MYPTSIAACILAFSRQRMRLLFLVLSLALSTAVAHAAPTITDFSPKLGTVNTVVAITGTGFTNISSVKFNGGTLNAPSYSVIGTTEIDVAAPSGVSTGQITVTTDTGSATTAVGFHVVAITSFSPIGGPIGQIVTLSGVGFTGATAVKFNGTSASTFSVGSDTSITATVPTGATTGPISITVPSGVCTSTSNYTVGATPTITDFSPKLGTVNTVVAITGTNFTNVYGVKFNGGTLSASYMVVGTTEIDATAPSGVATGQISVITATGTVTTANGFHVVSIDSFSPTAGPIGQVVTLSGVGFTGATAVKFNGTSASTFSVGSDTSITATVPTGATTGPISITVPSGICTSSSNYTNLIPLTVSLSPSTVTRGNSTTGTVTLNAAAPPSGINVVLTSSNASATVGSTAFIPWGHTTATFTVATPSTGTLYTSTIQASYNSVGPTTTLTITDAPLPTLVSLTMDPYGEVHVLDGAPYPSQNWSTGTITLDRAAPVSGAVITLSSSNANFDYLGSTNSYPHTVTVPAGQTSVTFKLYRPDNQNGPFYTDNPNGTPYTNLETTTMSASYNGITKTSAPVTIELYFGVTGVNSIPYAIIHGTSATINVSINYIAPHDIVTRFPVSCSDPYIIVPNEIIIPVGASSASFTLTDLADDPTVSDAPPINLSGGLPVGGQTLFVGGYNFFLVLRNNTLLPLTFNPSTVQRGHSTVATVTLDAPAKTGGVTLTLNPAQTTVPAIVTIPQGQTSTTFTINTSATATLGNTTITATAQHSPTAPQTDGSAPATLTITN